MELLLKVEFLAGGYRKIPTKHQSIYNDWSKMANFDKTDGPKDDEDLIIIHVGHLSDERYNRVVQSIIAFMNKRWPDVKTMGIDN